MIKYFTIYGERCSGTNFLMHAIKENFELEYTTKYAWKHFFGNYKFEKNDEENNTLFIGIIRDPIEWIDSFYGKLHHIPLNNKKNIYTFLFNIFYSIYDDTKTEIMEDRHIKTNNRYKNIFELRDIKNNYLINDMKLNVQNYLLIRYEDLRDNYDIVLNFFKNKFNLKQKYDNYVKINNYKGSYNKLFLKKNIKLNKNIISLIKNNINKQQENSIGYLI